MDEEIWKYIEGYEKLYSISNYGNVYSYITNRILKLSYNAKSKHLGVILCKNHKHKRFQIHRLVAIAFVPNPNKYNVVNHKDENPTNNYYKNLEWCTIKYNNQYSSYKLKGKIPWNKGIKTGPMSLNTRVKISNSHKNLSPSKETRLKISNSLKQYYKNKK